MRALRFILPTIAVVAFGFHALADEPPPGFKSLFNGKDFSGWTVPKGDNGHWKIVDGVIDYDAKSEAKGDKSLWSDKEYGDFVLRVDWKLKKDKGYWNNVPIILPNGNHKKDANGKEIRVKIEDVDSGIFLRGAGKSQVNIWMWPVGSGEVYGYRMSKNLPQKIRAGVTPKLKADNPRGEWNTFEIKMVGDLLSVKLNGKQVIENAQLPGIKSRGKIALQHHGRWNDKKKQWAGPPSLIQFRRIYIKELD